MGLRIILTGATGMAGEGVLLECLANAKVDEVLVIGRKPCGITHAKLNELIVPDFLQLASFAPALQHYDACFYCAGISSVGMDEARYTLITHTTTLAVAKTLLAQNPELTFNYITGRGTDSTGTSKVMWARVKGTTERDLMQLGFKGQYNFRPALMLPAKGQKNMKPVYKVLARLLRYVMPNATITLKQLALAMMHTSTAGYAKPVLEVADIVACAKE